MVRYNIQCLRTLLSQLLLDQLLTVTEPLLILNDFSDSVFQIATFI